MALKIKTPIVEGGILEVDLSGSNFAALLDLGAMLRTAKYDKKGFRFTAQTDKQGRKALASLAHETIDSLALGISAIGELLVYVEDDAEVDTKNIGWLVSGLANIIVQLEDSRERVEG